ncbi:hypothetical protein RUND412_008313 [Rhizina undulata]
MLVTGGTARSPPSLTSSVNKPAQPGILGGLGGLLRTLFIAPVGEDWQSQRILDIGTGLGIWVMDMADQYPSTKFKVDVTEDEWLYQPSTFDFVFIRHMAGFVYDWPKLYRQAFSSLKPGDDGSLPPDCILLEWEYYWEKATNDSGRVVLVFAIRGNSIEGNSLCERWRELEKAPDWTGLKKNV